MTTNAGAYEEEAVSAEMASVEGVAAEASVDAVVTEVCKSDRYREILYKLLLFCRGEGHTRTQAERYVAGLPEDRNALQEPCVLVRIVVDAGGIESFPLDVSGSVIPVGVLESMTADEREDATCDYLLVTSLAGQAAIDLLAPYARLRAKLSEKPRRYETYLAVLGFCRDPRSLSDVGRLFEENPDLVRDTSADSQRLSPDYYLSELERAGGLVWDGAWKTTEAGEELVETSRTGR